MRDSPKEQCGKHKPVSTLPNVSLTSLHRVFKKWFYITTSTRNMIDLMLATYLENELNGTPLWIIFKGASGDLKSEILNALGDYPKVIELNDLTPNTFVSGSEGVIDIGHKLQNRHRVIIIKDLSAMLSLHKEDKKAIVGKLRTLYDGFLQRDFGNIGMKRYEHITVNLLANCTHVIEEERSMAEALGTRELFYDTGSNIEDNVEKMKMAMENEENEVAMRNEIKDTVHDYLAHHRIDRNIEVPKEIEEFMMKYAQLLIILRAPAQTDNYSGEIQRTPVPEVPTRLIKQFKRIYKALKSLDKNYEDSRIRSIIKHIVLSSGAPNRAKILEIFHKRKDSFSNSFLVKDMIQEVRLGYKTTRKELDILWSMSILERINFRAEDNRVHYQYYLSEELDKILNMGASKN